MNIPDEMKAIVLKNYDPNLIRAMRNMSVEEVSTPNPDKDQVLVKVEASPVNPSDIAFLRGGYNILKTLPAIPGFEGTGTIIAVGQNLGEALIGKKVSFFYQGDQGGAWAEYLTLHLNNLIVLNDEMPVSQAACLFVNPFTAYALFESILENQHKALIQSAANGQVGRFIRYFAKKHNIETINLVRKPAHAEQLISEGFPYALDINDPDFEAKVRPMILGLHATAFIDAVGGELTGNIMNMMPPGTEVVLYGGLSGKPISGIDAMEVIFQYKFLGGFNLDDWMFEKDKTEFRKISAEIQQLFISKELETKIHQSFAMDDFYSGLRAYISNMSAGKVLLTN